MCFIHSAVVKSIDLNTPADPIIVDNVIRNKYDLDKSEQWQNTDQYKIM